MTGPVTLIPIPDFPRVNRGDDLAAPIAAFGVQSGDVVAIAQKVVSKSEGRVVALSSVKPSARADRLALEIDKDPRLVHLVLSESSEVIRARPGILITRHRRGFIMANAGIDASNVGQSDSVILLPQDPDRSARRIARALKQHAGQDVAVIVTDSWGRPWRLGTTGFAIGLCGIQAVKDMRGVADLDGRILETTSIGIGDELAAAASLLMGQAAEATPAVLIRGYDHVDNGDSATALIRPPEGDLFR